MSEKPRILVVEDDHHIRRIISMGLKLEGYDVITAENGLEGIKQLTTHGADAITLDLMMPIMDGRTFIQKVRSEISQDVPIVVLTSVDVEDATKDLTENGASAIVLKPATIPQIVRTLKQVSKIAF